MVYSVPILEGSYVWAQALYTVVSTALELLLIYKLKCTLCFEITYDALEDPRIMSQKMV